MHFFAGSHIAVVGSGKVVEYHFNRLKSQRVGKWAMQSGNVCFNCVCQGIHSGVSNLLGRKRFYKFGVNDSYIGSNVEVCQRVFDACRIVCNNGKCGNFGSSSRCGRDSRELSLLAQLREVERNAQIFKSGIGVFIESPHCLGCIDWWTAAHSNNPVRLKITHRLRTFHDSFYGRVRFNTFKKADFHTAFF